MRLKVLEPIVTGARNVAPVARRRAVPPGEDREAEIGEGEGIECIEI